jgi:hypothetical protein
VTGLEARHIGQADQRQFFPGECFDEGARLGRMPVHGGHHGVFQAGHAAERSRDLEGAGHPQAADGVGRQAGNVPAVEYDLAR